MRHLAARFALVILAGVGLLAGGPATAAMAANGWVGPSSSCWGTQLWVHVSEASGNLVRADGFRVKLVNYPQSNITGVNLKERVADGREWNRSVDYRGARDVKVENIPTSYLPWVRAGEQPTALLSVLIDGNSDICSLVGVNIVTGEWES